MAWLGPGAWTVFRVVREVCAFAFQVTAPVHLYPRFRPSVACLTLSASKFTLTFIVHFILSPSHQVIWQHLVVHGQLGHLHAAALPVSWSTASHPPAQELFASGRKHGSQVSQQIDATHVDTFEIFNNNRFWIISLLFAAVNEMMKSAGSGVRLPGCEAHLVTVWFWTIYLPPCAWAA